MKQVGWLKKRGIQVQGFIQSPKQGNFGAGAGSRTMTCPQSILLFIGTEADARNMLSRQSQSN